ncbi:unnamed protein product [Clonostachys byssicola]|uniref:Carrier domain-containing protein n=1 Tax=Clonostachys byssicola TaxID=160290 RepID=A0A9N9XV35_9HYPO|nr:unnamed protein product [Clonostachys byssicola]
MSDTCFGYLTSGRDIPIDDVDKIVGPLINGLISRIKLDGPVAYVLEETSRNLNAHFNVQHVSLARLQGKLGLSGQQLFNTGLSIRQDFGSSEVSQDLHFQNTVTRDPNEFDITIAAVLSGSQTQIQVVYRPDFIDEIRTLEVVETFQMAMEFLLQNRPEYHSQSLYDAFFTFRTGADRQSVEQNWKEWLHELESSQFPPLSNSIYTPKPESYAQHSILGIHPIGGEAEVTSLLWTAWAFLVAGHTGVDDATFGSITSSSSIRCNRDNTAGMEETLTVPTIVPVRITIDRSARVQKLREKATTMYSKLTKIRHIGHHWVQQLGAEGEKACEFQTVLEVLGDGEVEQPHLATSEMPMNFALLLKCVVRDNSIDLIARFDPSVIDKTQILRILRQFGGLIKQLSYHQLPPTTLSAAIQTISDEDVNDIWMWNSPVPEPVEGLVHDVFVKTAERQPNSPAICAWDGDMTYRQLDTLSTILAHQLVSLGAGPGTIIPLCFEKSKWTPVAMIGVMKSGAASVALDASHPEDRLRTIVKQVHSYSKQRLILCSGLNEDLSRKIAQTDAEETLVVVAERITQDKAEIPMFKSAEICPDDMLYVVFTSGSTGIPKGAIISHRNFSSAIRRQATQTGLDSSSRVFDFASYAFDAAWFNNLHTLAAGGCVCIPSDDDRQSNLVSSIVSLGANYLPITPSAARMIKPETVPKVRTLMFAGEKLLRPDVNQWKGHATVYNAYGIAECTIGSSVGIVEVGSTEPSIGRGCGSVTWVVRPDGLGLAAIGEAGELWIESPLVGQGYLGNPEKTAQAFIQDPPWLLQGGGPRFPGRRGRLYRTGDLVRYNSDGTLHFVGRKDYQVKIRGQRVELGDVESHIQQALASSPNVQVVAEVISPSNSPNPILVAFISPPGDYHEDSESLKSRVSALTHSLTDTLLKCLPIYMVPSVYIPIAKIPTTLTGKVNRKKLHEIGNNLDLGLLVQNNGSSLTRPSTRIESILATAWSEVLHIPIDQIFKDIPFTRLGGDSITAMQVISRLRNQQVYLSVGDILRYHTIERVSPRCKFDHDETRGDKVEDEQPWGLSPIQQQFFSAHPDGLNHFNQSFLLQVQQNHGGEAMRKAAVALVARHPMLRARFRRISDDTWEQYAVHDGPDSFSYAVHNVSVPEMNKLAQLRQESLDIVHGPVFAIDYFHLLGKEKNNILFSAHHLVIDLVSWRIIWQDLERLLGGAPLPPSVTTSFRRWAGLQQQLGSKDENASLLPFELINKPEFWDITPEQNLLSAVDDHNVHLDSASTSLLLQDCNASLRTKPVDIMVAVLIHSLHSEFPGRPAPAIFLEGHGRESLDDASIDLSETVGWFTSLYPVQISLTKENTIVEAVKFVKDVRSKIIGKGLPYFASESQKKGSSSFCGQNIDLKDSALYFIESRRTLKKPHQTHGG